MPHRCHVRTDRPRLVAVDAVKIANAAASLGIQRSINGVPDCPGYDEVIAKLEEDETPAEAAK